MPAGPVAPGGVSAPPAWYPPPQYGPTPPQYGPPPTYAPTPYGPAPNAAAPIVPHWAVSIVSFLLSGIIGAFALYFSAQVQPRLVAGNPYGAADASRKAQLIGWIGIVVGAVVIMAVYGGTSSS